MGAEEHIRAREKVRRCPVRRRKTTRPGEILRAALDVFVEKGFAATRIEDIAARAGAAKGTIYLYFENKEALFKAVVEAGLTAAVKAIEGLAAGTDRPAIADLRAYYEAWDSLMRETPMASLLKLLAAESSNFPALVEWFDTAVIRRARRAVTDTVEAGIARGELRLIRADLVADVLFSPMWLCAFSLVWRSFPARERLLDEAFDMLTRGIVSQSAV